MLPPHEYGIAAPADESAAPMLLLPISTAARYEHLCFVEGSERAPHFFSADTLPDELAGVVHRDDFALLIGAVNRIRADADKVESSRCRAFSRWLRAGGPASGSLTPNDAPDMQCVAAGRQALVDFLADETDVRWCDSRFSRERRKS